MTRINKEFLENYKAFDLNINANNIGEAAISNDDYIFFPLDMTKHGALINNILDTSCNRNHNYLLPKWVNKPAIDKTLIDTANSYLINQFSISKESIKREIPLTGEESARSRFSQLLRTYLPIFVLYITYLNNTPGAHANIVKYLSWDEDNIFLPLPVDKNSGEIIQDGIYENEEDSTESADPVTYDTKIIEELFDRFYDKVEKKIDKEMDNLKERIEHIYKMMPRSNVEFSKEMNGELIIDKNTDAMNEKVNVLNAKADILIKEQESKEMNMLKKENKEYLNKISDLEDKISLLKNDNDDLMKIVKDKDGAISELKNDIETLEATVDELKEELTEERKSTNSETEDTSAIIGVKDNEIAELKKELETRVENEKLLRERNAELEEGDNSLRKELNKVNEDNVNLNRELSTLQNEVSSYIDTNRKLERENEKLTATNKDLEKNINDLEKEIASIKKESGMVELEKIKEDNRILRQALEDLKHKRENEKYIVDESPKEVEDNLVSEKDPEVLAREKANRDRIGRMIYGDAYDGTQTF